MTPIQGIKIFQMDECDWWAGESLAACTADYIEQLGSDETLDDPHELSDEDIDRLIFTEDDGRSLRNGTQKPFRQKLEEMVKEGCQFPQMFASTEY